jgi:hypothetical protein
MNRYPYTRPIPPIKAVTTVATLDSHVVNIPELERFPADSEGWHGEVNMGLPGNRAWSSAFCTVDMRGSPAGLGLALGWLLLSG